MSGGRDSVRSAGMETKARLSDKHRSSMRTLVAHPDRMGVSMDSCANNNGVVPLSGINVSQDAKVCTS